MNRSFFFSIALMAIICSCGRSEDTFTITGKVDGPSKVYVIDVHYTPIDSSEVKNSRFTLRGKARPMEWGLFTDSTEPEKMTVFGHVYFEAGRITMIQEEEKQEFVAGKPIAYYQAVGTPANSARAKFSEACKRFDYSPEKEEWEQLLRTAVKENLSNLFGFDNFVRAFYQDIYTLEESLQILDSFSDEIKATEDWQRTYEYLSAQAKVLSSSYTDFSLQSVNTNEGEISLKSIVEREDTKYVLLDFWASWCGPCMGEMPYLVAAYAEYRSKGFEIFGCSLDGDKSDWTAAIKDNGMTWINVSNLNGWKSTGAALYDVHSIPANFLIDCSTGKIVATNLRGEAVASKLSELLD